MPGRSSFGDRDRTDDQWHLDEMVVVIRGKRFYLWRAVDARVKSWVS